MFKTIVIGTGNKDKLKELKRLLKDLNVQVLPISKFGPVPDVIEDGKTYAANASKKARIYSKLSPHLTLADDSGLNVNALNGKPGIYSARYAGPNCSYIDNCEKLLKALGNKPISKRKGTFVSTIALYKNGKRVTILKGTCKGHIGDKMSGRNGFGYDPVFIPDGQTKTFAQMTAQEKNKLSHRGKALLKTREFLEGIRNI